MIVIKTTIEKFGKGVYEIGIDTRGVARVVRCIKPNMIPEGLYYNRRHLALTETEARHYVEGQQLYAEKVRMEEAA